MTDTLNCNSNFEMPKEYFSPSLSIKKDLNSNTFKYFNDSFENQTNGNFILPNDFIDKYKYKKPDFGFNGLGEMVYKRTYSRLKKNGKNEQWYETVERVVNGTFNMQKKWLRSHHLPWNQEEQLQEAKNMYDKIFRMKFLPPGRGLWAMGSALTEEKELYASLNNCSFCSTEDIVECPAKPFTFLMDASMLGVGVGFDTRGAGKIFVKGINYQEDPSTFQIPDSREGWVQSLKHLLNSYFFGLCKVEFDYSLIRLAGEPIKGFGGISSGPQCLKDLHNDLRKVLDKNTGSNITVTTIVDIMNLIGKCVVAGNLRRCLPKNTLIHCKDGLKKIQDIKAGDLVYTSKGLDTVSELVYQGKQEILSINTQLGDFKCTPKHKVAVLDSPNTYYWTQAQYLKEGDRLVFPEHEIEGTKTKLPENLTACNSIVIPDLTDEISWLFGYCNTNFTKNGPNAYIACDNINYPEITIKVKKALSKFGNNMYFSDVTEKENDTCNKILVSKQLAWYFNTFNTPKKTINVPDFIMKSTKQIRSAYLAGLFDAVGSSKNSSIIGFSSIYEEYSKEIQCLYASLGIPVRIKKNIRKENNSKDIYLVSVVGTDSTRKFENMIAIHSKKYKNNNKTEINQNDYAYPSEWINKNAVNYGKHSKEITFNKFKSLGGNSNLIPITVNTIKYNKEVVETYDISVPGSHEFIAAEGLLVHNTAEIAFGNPNDDEYINLKNYSVNPHRMSYGWTSNNSVFANVGMDYSKLCSIACTNGEPGFAWLDNMQKYDRMNGIITNTDYRAKGGNPCLEQTLESFEMCCLVETFPNRHDSLEEYIETLKYAFLYAKTVTLGRTHWPETNQVMLRNRRIGTSMSGIAQFVANKGQEALRLWCETGYDAIKEYDQIFSDKFAVCKSIKITSIKPSGTVSLLAGATPGVHYPISRYYIRRVRLASDSDLIEPLQKAGYHLEPAVGSEKTTMVVSFPVDAGKGLRKVKEISMWEQLSLAAFLQRHWADNQVSCTVTFDPKTEGSQMKHALDIFQYQLKGISFLPHCDNVYPQMPYEEISEDKFKTINASLKPIQWNKKQSSFDPQAEKFCDGDHCTL